MRRAANAYGAILRRIGIGLGLTVAVVLLTSAIVTPLWLLATRIRPAYNILLSTIFLLGLALMFVRRVRQHSVGVGRRAAIIIAILTAGRILLWVFTIAVAPIFFFALLSVGATFAGIVLIIVDIGLIGVLITTGNGIKNDGFGDRHHS